MEEDSKQLVEQLKQKISLYDELIEERAKELETMARSLARVEDYCAGAKESLQKVEGYVGNQKKEVLELRMKQQLNVEAYNFIDGLFSSTAAAIKNLNLENEKLALTKRVEINSKNQEVAKLQATRQDYEKKMNDILYPPPPPPQAFVKEISTESKIKNRKFRPDKDPNTKAGRASLDLTARRKKAKQKSVAVEDKTSENK